MNKIGFDGGKYLELQSAKISERIAMFGDKLYLEFGGKLFDDYHASRVLPGFEPDSKIKMLSQLKDKAEILIAINSDDIQTNKLRSDLGITYDAEVIRLIDIFRDRGFYVGSVVLTRFANQPSAMAFKRHLEMLGDKLTYIDDDKPIIRYIDGEFYVYGTPWNGKHRLGGNVKAKLKCVCKIYQAKENSITKAEIPEMIGVVFNQTLRPEQAEDMEKLLSLTDKLLTKSNLYALGCNISREAAELSFKTMTGEKIC